MNATVRFIDSPIVFGHPPLIRCAVCRDHLMDNIDKEGMPE